MKDKNSTKNDYDDGNIPEIDLPENSASLPEEIKTTPNGEAPANRISSGSGKR